MKGAHNTNVDISFYNDRVKEVIAADIMAEPFTFIPIKAGHMELVGGNAIVFGKMTEGYDVIEPAIETEVTYEKISGNDPIIELAIKYVATEIRYTKHPPGRIISGVVELYIPITIIEGSIFNITVENIKEDPLITSTTATYTAVMGDGFPDVREGLLASMISVGLLADLTLQVGIPGDVIRLLPRNYFFNDEENNYQLGKVEDLYKNFIIDFYYLLAGYSSKFPQLKCGATHAFGIVYKDRSARTCSVIRNNTFDVYIPYYSEPVDTDDNDIDSILDLKFKIWHRPPAWAESYEIVYYGNISMDYWMQIRASDINSLGSNRYALNIIETFEWIYNKNNRWRAPEYEWQTGDRIRLLGTIDEGTGDVSKFSDTYYGEPIGTSFFYDYEIEETGTQYGETIGGEYLIFQAVNHPEPFEGSTNILVEVYRPRRGLGSTIPYGTGMVFLIGTDQYGNKYHKGNSENSDIDQEFDVNYIVESPAEINNMANDCWKYLRLNYKDGTADIQSFWCESFFASDWWDNLTIPLKLTSMGFPFLDDLSQRQVVLDERLRHGGFIIDGTRTNNLAHFTYQDFLDLPKKNGDITGLREIGYTLKVLQMYKETSIYINRVETFSSDGTSQFTLTDKFLADVRPMEERFGCQHPDSIMVNGRNLYYWDNTEAAFVRSSPNGQVVLDIKMKRWFKDLISWIHNSGGHKLLEVRIGANNDHEEVWITFRMGEETRGVIFSEKDGRFKTRINQPSETYIHLGNFFAHVYHQRIWLMNVNEGQKYLRWSGSDVEAELEFVSNIDSKKNKIFNALALYCDHQLEVPIDYIYIPAEGSASSTLMQTLIAIWDESEGIFYGQILKDKNTPGNWEGEDDSTMNGREIRGRYCFVRLKTTERDSKVRLDSVIIFSTPSERSS
jgi:hypothetical protein